VARSARRLGRADRDLQGAVEKVLNLLVARGYQDDGIKVPVFIVLKFFNSPSRRAPMMLLS